MKKKKVVIIGSGVAGLSTAIRLANDNYNVTVLESNNYVGGKLSEFSQNGFRFDKGPSLFTLPNLVLDLIKESGLEKEVKFDFEKLDLVCNYFFEDGTKFSAYSELTKFTDEIKSKLNVDAEPIVKYLKHAEKTYHLIGELFLEQSLHQLKNFTNNKTAKALLHLSHYRLFKTLNQHNEAVLKHPKLVQYFNRFATYNGSSPYLTPAMLSIISHIEHGFGAYFPKKGMYQITDTLYNIALKKGVIFSLNTKAEQILVENKKVIGVQTTDAKIDADIVVSNMDVFHTYKKLLPYEKHPDKILNQEKSSSAVIFYWGIKHNFKELDLHNIFFSNNYKEEFDAIFTKKEVYNDPTIYINITSKKLKTDAPNGCENWFVMVNTPNNSGQDWKAIKELTKQNVLKKLNRILGLDVAPLIVFEDYLDPILIEERTSSHLGALYGNASNNKMAAFLRHPNFSKDINGLYFCGGSVHPGGGVPLAILSGKITAQLIKEKQ